MITRAEFMSMVYLANDKKKIKQLTEEVIADSFPVETIMEMTSSPNTQCSFHCSLLLETLFTDDSKRLDPILEQLCKEYSAVKFYSTSRTFAKILTNVYRLKSQGKATAKMLEVTDGKYDDIIVDGCFKQLQANEPKISAVIWHIQLLTFFMNKKNVWIKDEVLAIIERMRLIDSPAFSVFVRKYSEKIKNL